jgi:hypothetical protein
MPTRNRAAMPIPPPPPRRRQVPPPPTRTPREGPDGRQESPSSASTEGPVEIGMIVTVLPGASSRPPETSSPGAGSDNASLSVGAVTGSAAATCSGWAEGAGAGAGLGRGRWARVGAGTGLGTASSTAEATSVSTPRGKERVRSRFGGTVVRAAVSSPEVFDTSPAHPATTTAVNARGIRIAVRMRPPTDWITRSRTTSPN